MKRKRTFEGTSEAERDEDEVKKIQKKQKQKKQKKEKEKKKKQTKQKEEDVKPQNDDDGTVGSIHQESDDDKKNVSTTKNTIPDAATLALQEGTKTTTTTKTKQKKNKNSKNKSKKHQKKCKRSNETSSSSSCSTTIRTTTTEDPTRKDATSSVSSAVVAVDAAAADDTTKFGRIKHSSNSNSHRNRSARDGIATTAPATTTRAPSHTPFLSSISRGGEGSGGGRFTTTVEHPFPVDAADHCETPLQAYQDLVVVLDQMVVRLQHQQQQQQHQRTVVFQRSDLRIYDPYYCDGGVKTKLAALGYTNVINENRDFYHDIHTQAIPEYDILITNPPYSGEHIEQLLQYIVAASSSSLSSNNNKNRNKPCFLLLPHFVYTKDYYERTIGRYQKSNTYNNGPPPSSSSSFFYFLIPEHRYAYVPPEWVTTPGGGSKALAKGKETTSPFPSFWYCHVPAPAVSSSAKKKKKTTSQQQQQHTTWLETTFGTSGTIRSQHRPSKLRYAQSTRHLPRDFKGEFDTSKKRPNPKARKRLAALQRKKFQSQHHGHR